VERVVEIGLDKVVQCQKALGQNVMTPADMRFLQSFTKVMTDEALGDSNETD